MIRYMIVQNVLHRPLRTLLTAIAVAVEVTMNDPVETSRFVLAQPPGSTLVRVGEESNEPQPLESKPQEPKPPVPKP